jgi:hypothetical protein
MPDPVKVLKTLQQAARSFRATPGRHGRLVNLQDSSEVMVVGDLHGHVENFRRVLDHAQLAKYPRRHLVLQELIHGPFRYPAGGDKSHQLLDLLAALKCQFPNQVHMLLGNHELAQWTGQAIAKQESDLNQLFREGVGSAYFASASTIYAAYVPLFAEFALAVRAPNRVFISHSLPSANRFQRFDPAILEKESFETSELEPGSAVHCLVWGRDTRQDTVNQFMQKVDADLLITGHIPCPQGFAVPNDKQLILDALGAPACYCLFPSDRLLTQGELVACVKTL